jgi:hypothetical protein
MTYLGLHSQNRTGEELDGGGVIAEEVVIAEETELGADDMLGAEVRSADEVVGLLVRLEAAVIDIEVIEVNGVSVPVVVRPDVQTELESPIGTTGPPMQAARVSSFKISTAFSISPMKHCCSRSKPMGSAGCIKSVTCGAGTVLAKIEVVPVPEHAVSVEHSVTKLLVVIAETIAVPLHLVMVLAEQLDAVEDSFCDGDGFWGSLGMAGTLGLLGSWGLSGSFGCGPVGGG